MTTNTHAAFPIGTFAVAAAAIIVASALIAGRGDPEAMSLGMLAGSSSSRRSR